MFKLIKYIYIHIAIKIKLGVVEYDNKKSFVINYYQTLKCLKY